jgi:hypothetical protein
MAKSSGSTAEPLHEEDIVEILLRQHARIREEFILVKAATGDERRARFADLRALLVAHETAEEMVLRPVSTQTAGPEVAQLDGLDVTGGEFDALFRVFQDAVLAHASSEETEEFPLVQKGRSADELASMGRVLLAVEKLAPTRPHPSTAGSGSLQWAVGPLASALDRARDALSSATGRPS